MFEITIFIIVMAAISFALLTWFEFKYVREDAYRLWQFEAVKAKLAIEALTLISTDSACNHQARMHAHNVLNRIAKAEELTEC